MHCSWWKAGLVAILLGCSSSDGQGAESENGDQGDVTSAGDVSGSASNGTSGPGNPSDGQGAVGAPSPSQTNGLPAGCYIGPADCDPRTGKGCGEGAACDFSSQGKLVCFPPPNDAAVGQPCNNQGGPFCAAGGWCVPETGSGPGTCRKVCCSTQECSDPGFECVGLLTNPSQGSIGVCRTPPEPAESPECLPYGAPCNTANDACCGQCHFDHCH